MPCVLDWTTMLLTTPGSRALNAIIAYRKGTRLTLELIAEIMAMG